MGPVKRKRRAAPGLDVSSPTGELEPGQSSGSNVGRPAKRRKKLVAFVNIEDVPLPDPSPPSSPTPCSPHGQDHLARLSMEVLCYMMSFLPLKDVMKLDGMSRWLRQAVTLYLRLANRIDLTEDKLYGWMPAKFNDHTFFKFMSRCVEVTYLYGLHPLSLSRRPVRGESSSSNQLTVSGVVQTLNQCKKLKGIETCSLQILQVIIDEFPEVEILGVFGNRNGAFPISTSPQCRLDLGNGLLRISTLNLTGVTVPRLPVLPFVRNMHLQWVRFLDADPFADFTGPMLQSFVMRHCAGPATALKYVALATGLASARQLQRLELVRVPFLGGLMQHVVEDRWRLHGYRTLKKVQIAACKHALEVDVGYLMINSNQTLEELILQPSLSKDSLFSSLQLAGVDFLRFERLSIGYVDDFPDRGYWSNEELVRNGLSDVIENPAMITDLGMRSAGMVLPTVKSLTITNCPHLHHTAQWFNHAASSWMSLRDLTLSRCHAIRLEEFSSVLPLLTALEYLYLDQMFREPPKGCSRVGLSAGTGLGVSSALVSNAATDEVVHADGGAGVPGNPGAAVPGNPGAGAPAQPAAAAQQDGAPPAGVGPAGDGGAGVQPGGVPHNNNNQMMPNNNNNDNNQPGYHALAAGGDAGSSGEEGEGDFDDEDEDNIDGGVLNIGLPDELAHGSPADPHAVSRDSQDHVASLPLPGSPAKDKKNKDKEGKKKSMEGCSNYGADANTPPDTVHTDDGNMGEASAASTAIASSSSTPQASSETPATEPMDVDEENARKECKNCDGNVACDHNTVHVTSGVDGIIPNAPSKSNSNEENEDSSDSAVLANVSTDYKDGAHQIVNPGSPDGEHSANVSVVSSSDAQPSTSAAGNSTAGTSNVQPANVVRNNEASTSKSQDKGTETVASPITSTVACCPNCGKNVTLTTGANGTSSVKNTSDGDSVTSSGDKVGDKSSKSNGDNSSGEADLSRQDNSSKDCNDDKRKASKTRSSRSLSSWSKSTSTKGKGVKGGRKYNQGGSKNGAGSSTGGDRGKSSSKTNQSCQAISEEIRESTKQNKPASGTSGNASADEVVDGGDSVDGVSGDNRKDTDHESHTDSEYSYRTPCSGSSVSGGSTSSASDNDSVAARVCGSMGRRGMSRSRYQRKPNTCDQSTSTSDPVIEDDHIQVLTIKSDSLTTLILRQVGISDLVLKDCPRLSVLTASACRTLKGLTCKRCPQLQRVSFAQCAKLDHHNVVKEICNQPCDQDRIIFLRPMKEYNPVRMTRQILGSPQYNYHVGLLHDYTTDPQQLVQQRMATHSWMALIASITKHYNQLVEEIWSETGIGKIRRRQASYPWLRRLYRLSGSYSRGGAWDFVGDLPWLRHLVQEQLQGTTLDQQPAYSTGEEIRLRPSLESLGQYASINMPHLHNMLEGVYAELCDGNRAVPVGRSALVHVTLCDLHKPPTSDVYV